MTDEIYTDADGNVCTLDELCRREPAWAAYMIRLWRSQCHERASAESAAIARIDAALKVLADAGCSCECLHERSECWLDCERCVCCRVEMALRGAG